MVFCPECGAGNDDNAVYCQECGSKLNVKIIERVVEKSPGRKPRKNYKKFWTIFAFLVLISWFGLFAWIGPGATASIRLSNMIFGIGIVILFLFSILIINYKA